MAMRLLLKVTINLCLPSIEHFVTSFSMYIHIALCRITGLWFTIEMVQRLLALSQERLADPAIAEGAPANQAASAASRASFAVF